MKFNYKLFKNIDQMGLEPFETQQLDGVELELYYLNETNHLADNVTRGRFYLWAGDGVTYRLVIERGFYQKVNYFFAPEVNQLWLNFLIGASKVRRKSMPISMGISFVPILLAILGFVLFPDQATYILIGGFALSLIGNMVYTSKLNKQIQELNRSAHIAIQDLLTPEVFAQFFEDQKLYHEEYYKENFGSDDEDYEDESELLETDIEEVDELEALDELPEFEEVEEVVDLSKLTVAELRNLAKELELTGYSSLKKADLIALIEENL